MLNQPNGHHHCTSKLYINSDDVKVALQQWYAPNSQPSPLQRLYRFRQIQQENDFTYRRTANQILLDALETLTNERRLLADFLSARFHDEKTIPEIETQLNVAQTKAFALQKEAIQRLTQLINEMESVARIEKEQHLLGRLETSSSTNLIGIDSHLEHIMSQLQKAEAPYIIALSGMGGVGKTSLANHLARHVIREGPFDDVGWVTARQTHLNLMGQIEPEEQSVHNIDTLLQELIMQLIPSFIPPPNFSQKQKVELLQQHLHQNPHLIIMDNLETIEEMRTLFLVVRQLINPSKVILTTREQLYTEPNIHHFVVPPLSRENALKLVRQEATIRHLPALIDATDDYLYPIYETVGGNPLALRLVVGLTHVSDLEGILDDLRHANNETAEQLYSYIYRQAWDNLNELSRHILTFMPLIQQGGDDIDALAELTQLSKGELRAGLRQLIMLNLVNAGKVRTDIQTDVQGDSEHSSRPNHLYSIHGLTRTFLLEQVVLWQ